jgi:hypothetical protein
MGLSIWANFWAFMGHPPLRRETQPNTFVVLIVNILWISNVLHCLVPQDTDHSNNRLHSVIRMKMILVVNIIVIFVKKSEIQNTGSTIVQTLVFLLIPIAFLGDFLVSSLGGLTHLTCTNIPSLWLTRARESIFRVIDVVVLAMTLLLNVSIVISIFIGGAFPIVMPWLFEIFPFNIVDYNDKTWDLLHTSHLSHLFVLGVYNRLW